MSAAGSLQTARADGSVGGSIVAQVGTDDRRSLNSTDLKRLHRKWRRAVDADVALLFDKVSNPFNVGSILRTAAAMRVSNIYMAGFDGSIGDAKVQKTAIGSHKFIDIAEFATTEDAAAAARNAGYQLVALELATDSVPLYEIDMSANTCIVIGHEERGVSNATLRSCDHLGYIPQMGRVGSLNVATATSIACYEVRRQQLAAASPVQEDF